MDYIMEKQDKKVLVCLSGGQDSITCLYYALAKYEEVTAISFNYGQNHSIETEMAQMVCDRESVELKRLDIAEIMALSKSELTTKGGDVNKVRPDGLPSSFVPNRNMIFLTLANSYAQMIGAEVIVTGVCQTDFSGYPDCREVFIKSLQETLKLATEKEIQIETPLMYLDKADTFGLAVQLGVLSTIIEDTMTCYNGNTTQNAWGRGCGECPACQLRSKGFIEFIQRLKDGRYQTKIR